MQYLVQCTRTRVARKNLSVMMRHGLHGFALDQPSINEIGPINPSEKMKRSETDGNGRKQSETWSGQNLSNPHFFKTFPRNAVFFLKVQRCPRGNGWKQSEIAQKNSCFVAYEHYVETCLCLFLPSLQTTTIIMVLSSSLIEAHKLCRAFSNCTLCLSKTVAS